MKLHWQSYAFLLASPLASLVVLFTWQKSARLSHSVAKYSVKRQPKSYLTGLVRYPHKQKIGCRDFSRKILDLGSRQASLSHVNRLLNRKARMPQESWALNIKRQLNVSCINMDYYKISNRTLKISHQNCKNISRYYHISFQGNLMNFTPHSKILEIW